MENPLTNASLNKLVRPMVAGWLVAIVLYVAAWVIAFYGSTLLYSLASSIFGFDLSGWPVVETIVRLALAVIIAAGFMQLTVRLCLDWFSDHFTV